MHYNQTEFMQGMQGSFNIKKSVNIIYTTNKFFKLYVHFSISKTFVNINTILLI